MGARRRTEVETRRARGRLPARYSKSYPSRLHEGMRNYGSVENDRKAPLVSAILLALEKPGFALDDMKGLYDQKLPDDWDGAKIYKAANGYMISEGFGPQQKIGTLLDQFSFIKQSPVLNRVHKELGLTPLKWFAQILKTDVQKVVTDPSMSSFDVLGNFYHEFISYGGGDGNTLGIVLPPEHVTSLMAELIDVGAGDWVLDPAAGTAAFLIAAMHRMFKDAGNNETMKDDIRKNRLHGIELQDKLFAIGTTNMILRGDGKANFRRDSIFEAPLHEMRGDRQDKNGEWIAGHGFTKVLLNPPYSQSKDGTRLTTADRRTGRIPFVAGSRMNNSITDFADTPSLFPGGWVTLIYNGDGGTGHAKYQPAPFSASDDVIVLEPVSDLATEPALLLIASMLTQQCVPKFGFGYKLTLHRLGRQKIMAPVISNAIESMLNAVLDDPARFDVNFLEIENAIN